MLHNHRTLLNSSDNLPDTMLPTQYPDSTQPQVTIISDSPQPGATGGSIDDLAVNVNSFIQQFKSLQRDYTTLKDSFDAQNKELKRSRAEYQRKVEEWRIFKASLSKQRSGHVDKSVMTGPVDANGESEVVLTQDTASLLRLDDTFTDPTTDNYVNTPGIPESKRARPERLDTNTPPGYWEVNFTPAHRIN